MSDNKRFSFDSEQLEKILQTLKKNEKQSKVSISQVFTLVQLLAILLSGCWVIYQYLDYQKEANELDISKIKLEIEKSRQDSIIKEIDIRYNEALILASMQSQNLRNDFDLIKLQYADLLSRHEVKSKELENAIKSVDAVFAEEIKNLEIKRNQIEVESREFTLQKRKKRKLIDLYGCNCELIKENYKNANLYRCNLEVNLKNDSEDDIKVSATIFEMYLANLDLKLSYYEGINQHIITSPPNIFNSRINFNQYYLSASEEDTKRKREEYERNSRTHWHLITRESNYFAGSYLALTKKFEDYFDISKDNVIQGSSGTGILKPGESFSFTKTCYFTADESHIAGVGINLILNDAKTNEDLIYYSHKQVLINLTSD